MHSDLDPSTKSTSPPETNFLPDDGSVPRDVLVLVLLIRLTKYETGRHDGRRGKWVFSPGSETLDCLEEYRVDNQLDSRDRARQDGPRHSTQDRPFRPRSYKDYGSSRFNLLEDSGQRLDRGLRAIHRKERDLEKDNTDFIESCYTHEEKARGLRKSMTRARTHLTDAYAETSRDRGDSRESDKRRRPNQAMILNKGSGSIKNHRDDKEIQELLDRYR